MGASEAIVEELLNEGNAKGRSEFKYDPETRTVTISSGALLIADNNGNIKISESERSQHLHWESPISLPFMETKVTYKKGEIVDIRTLPRHQKIPDWAWEQAMIQDIKVGHVNADYDPGTHMLTINNGILEIDANGGYRYLRDLDTPVRVKMIIDEQG